MVPGSGRIKVLSIPVGHLDFLWAVITGVRFVVLWWYHGRNWNKDSLVLGYLCLADRLWCCLHVCTLLNYVFLYFNANLCILR